MGQQDNRRSLKNYFIHKEIQKSVIINSLVYMFLILLLTMAIMLWHATENISETSIIVGEAASAGNISMSTKLYFVLAVAFLLAVANQLWLTHKFCGALFNFSKTFSRIAEGDLTRKVVLRKHDMLKEEAAGFNHMMDNITASMTSLKQDSSTLLETLKAVTDPNADPSRIEAARKMLLEQEPLINEHLSRLKLTDS